MIREMLLWELLDTIGIQKMIYLVLRMWVSVMFFVMLSLKDDLLCSCVRIRKTVFDFCFHEILIFVVMVL